MAGNDLRQQFPRNADRPARAIVPASLPHIEAGQPVSLGQILRDLTGHPVDDVAVGLQDLCRLPVCFRPVLLIPEDLRPGISGLRRIAAQTEKLFFRQPLRGFPADPGAPRICPDRRRAQDFPGGVQRDGGPALPVHADAGDLRRINVVFADHLPDRAAYAVPPVPRILFRPSLFRIADRVIRPRGRCHRAVFLKQRNLTGGCPDVDPQQIFRHRSLLLSPVYE